METPRINVLSFMWSTRCLNLTKCGEHQGIWRRIWNGKRMSLRPNCQCNVVIYNVYTYTFNIYIYIYIMYIIIIYIYDINYNIYRNVISHYSSGTSHFAGYSIILYNNHHHTVFSHALIQPKFETLHRIWVQRGICGVTVLPCCKDICQVMFTAMTNRVKTFYKW